jgi:hypothetical protein
MNPNVYSQLPGDAGIFQTVYMMKELVNKNFLHPWIRERAARAVSSCGKNIECQDRALLVYVNQAVQYLKDPTGVEALHDPVTFTERMLRNGKKPFGDCDDMSIYLATLLKSIGHKPRFRILSRLHDGAFHHVIVFCHDKNLDPSMTLGREPKNPTRAVQVEI